MTARRPCLRCLRFAAPALVLAALATGKPITPSGLALFPSAPVDRAAEGLIADILPGAAQFETVPSPLPANLDSLGFAVTGTSEFGDLVRLGGASHFIGSVAVTLTSGASRASFPGYSPLGFSHPITLTLYAVERGGASLQPGAVLGRLTETFLIPWRAEPTAAAALPGRAFTITFDLATLGIALPDEVIFGVSFNTHRHGPVPMGAPGPYDLLGIGVTDRPAGVGVDVQPDAVFWRTTGTNVFLPDAGWAPYKPAVRFTNSAYGALFEIAARLEALRGPDRVAEAAVSLAASLTALTLDRSLWDGNAQLRPVLGRYAFDLLAEAADELSHATAGVGALATEAQSALEALQGVASLLAESATADAIIFGGNARRVLRAQVALDTAADDADEAKHGSAIDHFGLAWQEAQAALR